MVAAAAAKSLQSCPILCDPIDGSPLGSSVPGILQARILEWVTISFSNAWKWKVKAKLLSRARLLVTPWTAAYLTPLSMGFSRQESWSGLPLPSPGRYGRHLYISVKWKWKSLSHVWLFVIPWTNIVHGILQARILEWVAFPFSRGSAQPRDQTQVSCIAGRFFTNWATRERLYIRRAVLCKRGLT